MKQLSRSGNYSPGDPPGGPPIPTTLTRPLAAVARRLAPPPVGSDAELLDRWRFGRDQEAFSGLVRRHAPAVRAVARARLANPTDAEDVAQAAFLVLARDAGRVRESVAGFLLRVTHLTALQHRRNLARRKTDGLPEALAATGDDPADAAASREAAGVVAEELAGLPDKFRAVLALCALDGLTAAVAAERLGVPKGTVDTRLAAAKRKLADRLTRRGLAVGAALLATVPAPAEFADRVAGIAVEYVAAVGPPSPLTLLADGVRPVMSNTARLFALGMVAAAVTGTAGTAYLHGRPADDKPQAKKPADPPPQAAALVAEEEPKPKPRLIAEADVRQLLAQPSTVPEPQNLNLGALLDYLETQGLDTRIDLPALLRAGFPSDQLAGLRDTKIKSFGGRGTTWADLLADAVAPITWGGQENGALGRMAYRVSGNRVVLGPAYLTPGLPGLGANADHTPFLPNDQLAEQLVGPPVSVAVDGQPLARAVDRLRALTGANIVLDARARDKTQELVAGTFDDVRLLTVLQVLADQAGLKPVTLNNVYYLTDPANAATLQKQADRDLFGTPQVFGGPAAPPVAIPAGLVTDGYQYFPRTADMKPVDPRGVGSVGGLGFGGGGGLAIQPLPGTQPVPAPAAPPPAKR